MPEVKLKAVKPEKAIQYWKTRRPLTAKESRVLEKGARSRALAVAGLTRYQQLAAVYGALNKALDEGKTLADFKKEIAPIIEGQGWKSWRVETIFRTNLAAAYAAGAWAEIQATKKAFPYLQYLTVGDEATRPSHAVLHGKVYPVDHEFWTQNYPPNGFGCRCMAVPVSRWRAEKEGAKIETEMPGTLIYRGPGSQPPIAVNIPGADAGFRGNAGKDWLDGLAPSELNEALTFGPARMVCPVSGEFAGPSGACGLPLDQINPRHILPVKKDDILPGGQSEEFYALEFLKLFGLKGLNASKLITLPGVNLPLVISKDLLTDKTTGLLKADKFGRGVYMRLLAQTITNPFEIWRVPGVVSGKPYEVLRLIRLFNDSGNTIGGFGVFNLIPGKGWKGATVFTPNAEGSAKRILSYLERQRKGHLLYREK